MIESIEEEDNCPVCNIKRPIETWIACDTCNRWFHQQCVGVTAEEANNEEYHCQQCKDAAIQPSASLKRGYSEITHDVFEKD